jgi:hypothetical protein
MAKIYRYRKVTDEYTTHCLCEPDYERLDAPERITELCTLGGWTYASVPDDLSLPPQPEIIAATLEEVDMEELPELKAEIIAAAPACIGIRGRVVDRIRERYSVNDEIKMLRTGPTEESEAYNDYVEACRTWGRQEKAKLGLG